MTVQQFYKLPHFSLREKDDLQQVYTVYSKRLCGSIYSTYIIIGENLALKINNKKDRQYIFFIKNFVSNTSTKQNASSH